MQTIQTFIIWKFKITEPVIRDFRVVQVGAFCAFFAQGSNMEKGQKVFGSFATRLNRCCGSLCVTYSTFSKMTMFQGDYTEHRPFELMHLIQRFKLCYSKNELFC